MNIPSLTNAQARGENRRSAAGQAQTSGASFQDRLARTTAAAKQRPAAEPPQAPFDRSALTKNDLLSTLSDFKTSMLDRMRKAKENEEEQEAWDKLMKYLDAWIDSLREDNADIRKSAKAYADLQSTLSDTDSGKKDLASCILEQLTQSLST